jgi:hypothetical protein
MKRLVVDGQLKYIREETLRYYSKRYRKRVIVEKGYPSDGATGAIDILSNSWWVHDKLCDTGLWSDGTRVTNWQASWVLSDVLWAERQFLRAIYWFFPTFLLGGGKCRENGMFKLKEQA